MCFQLSSDRMTVTAEKLVHCQRFKCLTPDYTEMYVLVQPKTLETYARLAYFSYGNSTRKKGILILINNNK